MIDIFVNKTS